MTPSTQRSGARAPRFWTPACVTFTFILLALITALGTSSCNSTEGTKTGGEAGANTNTSATATNSSAPVAVTNSAPATTNNSAPGETTLTPLPTSISNAELKTLDGKVFKLSDYAGKVVLLNLWATWCGPCRQETPELEKLSKEYKARGVEFIGITSPGNDPEPERVKAFVREQKVSYTIAYAEDEFVGTLMQGRNVIPQSYVITRSGHLLVRFVGFSPVETLPKLRQALEQAANEKA
ncbi:MAG TPA: TlpA disulfide reductase family protein [Pyrinomonadaceae bacterium]|jgi:thiol-disulfide isomerase/thioredoxin